MDSGSENHGAVVQMKSMWSIPSPANTLIRKTVAWKGRAEDSARQPTSTEEGDGAVSNVRKGTMFDVGNACDVY